MYSDKEMQSIKCGGIVVNNLKFTGIARKKVQNDPNLERVVFVPFISQWVGSGLIRKLENAKNSKLVAKFLNLKF